jgi:hypothetical protein
MTDFSHYLAKNHATKNVIELKWAPGPRAQYERTPWGSATQRKLTRTVRVFLGSSKEWSRELFISIFEGPTTKNLQS